MSSTLPRARILVVDGTSWPAATTTSTTTASTPTLSGRDVTVRGANHARIVETSALELLVEDGAIDDATLIGRGRGIDALVVIEGPMLRNRVDALAVTSILNPGVGVIAVCAPASEPRLREILLAAGLDADTALMVHKDIAPAIDARLGRLSAARTRLRAVSEGNTNALLVSGEAPFSGRVWALNDDGFWPHDVVFPSQARAGDVISLQRPPWRSVDGTLDDPRAPGPTLCLAGRVVLDPDGDAPPRGADVEVFSDGGESAGHVDESGAIVLQRALPLANGAALGVLITRTGIRPGRASAPGALAARAIRCWPHPTRAVLRRRPSLPADVDSLFSLHERTMRAQVEATWGAWDDGDQRRRFLEKGAQPGRFQLVVHVDTGEIVASYRVERLPQDIVLASIAVAPEWQRRGIGSEIVTGLVREAEREHGRVRLTVLKSNDQARDLYDRLGFTMLGSTSTHFHMAIGAGTGGVSA